MDEILKALSVIGISSVKFIGGPVLGYAYDYSTWEIILYTVIGGMAGVVGISYFSQWVMALYHKYKKNRLRRRAMIFEKKLIKVALENPGSTWHHTEVKSTKKIFSKRNRNIVKYWKKFGLAGIAIFTPVFISIPIGTFIAMKYVPDRKKVMAYMFCSLIFWAFVITGIFQLFANPQV